MTLALLLVASIALVQPAPHVGDAVTFALVYPQDAARQSRQPQYPDNPNTQIDCWQTAADGSSFEVAQFHTIVDRKSKLKVANGWWQGTTYAVLLSAPAANGLPGWSSGAATCLATLYSFDVNNQGHVWAQTQFTVAP